MRTKNPFADWRPAQQCTRGFAFTQEGDPVEPRDRRAVMWCAIGWAEHQGLPTPEWGEFSDYLQRKHKHRMSSLNDHFNWMPEMFAAAWDEFQKESQ